MRAKWLPYLFIGPSLTALIVLVFYPLSNGIYLSFTDATQLNSLRRIPNRPPIEATYEFIGLDNYRAVLTDEVYYFWVTFQQTLIWTASNIVLHIIIGLALALLLNRKIRGRGIYRMLLIVPWAVPTYISAYAWRFLFNAEYGFINNTTEWLGLGRTAWFSSQATAMFAVVMANTWIAIPFNMVAFLGGLQSIPNDLYEAADVDGTNGLQKFFFITLPMLRPVMVTVSLLGVIWTFNSFNMIYLVSEGAPARKTEILATWAWRLGFDQRLYGIAAAYSVLILIILIFFSFFYMRLVSRSSQGSVL